MDNVASSRVQLRLRWGQHLQLPHSSLISLASGTERLQKDAGQLPRGEEAGGSQTDGRRRTRSVDVAGADVELHVHLTHAHTHTQKLVQLETLETPVPTASQQSFVSTLGKWKTERVLFQE